MAACTEAYSSYAAAAAEEAAEEEEEEEKEGVLGESTLESGSGKEGEGDATTAESTSIGATPEEDEEDNDAETVDGFCLSGAGGNGATQRCLLAYSASGSEWGSGASPCDTSIGAAANRNAPTGM